MSILHRVALAAAAIVVLVAAAFLVLQVIHGGKFPERAVAQDLFEERRLGFESLYQQLVEDGFSRVLCYPDKVFAGFDPKGVGQPVLGEELEVYLPLCEQAFAGTGWRTDSGFLFHIGGATIDGHDFNLAYIRVEDEPADVPDCSLTEPLGDFGKCRFKLDADWRLQYEWHSLADLDGLANSEESASQTQ